MIRDLRLDPCPCGSGRGVNGCCGPLIARIEAAETAEALMRSRFTAFVMSDADYLLYSWHPSSRPTYLEFSADRVWTSLEIKLVLGGAASDAVGEVGFVAGFKEGGIDGAVKEHSYFQRHDGRWVYVRGIHSR